MTAPARVTTGSPNCSGSAVAMILGSCISLQFGAALATSLFGALGPWGVTTLRLSIAGIILAIVTRPRLRSWSRGQWRSVAALGAVLGGMNGSFYMSIAHIPLGTAVAIEFLGPLLLSAGLSRRRADAAWVALAMAGMALLGVESIAGKDSLDPVGVVFALIAGAFWVGYILCGARVGQHVPGNGGLAMALAIAAVCVLPIGGAAAVHAVTDPRVLGVAIATALLASVIPYTLELGALRRLPRHVFGILLSLEPIVAALAGWLLLHQSIGPLRLAAIFLVIVASIGTTATARAGEVTQKPETSAT